MLVLQLVLLLILLVLIAVALLIFAELIRVGRGDVPYVPSTTSVIEEVIRSELLPKQGVTLDLGCGDGKLLRRLARAGYTGPLIGYERALVPWLVGRFLVWIQRVPVEIRRADISTAPLEQAAGVYLFLLPTVLTKIAPVLRERLPMGTPVVSAEFAIADWTPSRTHTAKGITAKHVSIFSYQIHR